MAERNDVIIHRLRKLKIPKDIAKVVLKYDYFLFLEKGNLIGKHNSDVRFLISLSDGRVISASENIIKIFDSENSELLKIIKSNGSINDILITSDNKIIIAADDIRILDLETKNVLNTFRTDSRCWIIKMLTPTSIISGSLQGELKIWDLNTGEGKLISNEGDPLAYIHVISDRYIIVAKLIGEIRIWDIVDIKLIGEIRDTGPHESIVILPSNLIFTQMDDGTVKLFDFRAKFVANVSDESYPNFLFAKSILLPNGMIISPVDDSKRIPDLPEEEESYTSENYFIIWDIKRLEYVFHSIHIENDDIFKFLVLPDNKILILSKTTIQIFNTETYLVERAISSPTNVEFTSMDILPNGKIIVGYSNGKIRIFS